VGPLLQRMLIDRHHVLVGHKDHGFKSGVAALPGVQQAEALHDFAAERPVKAGVGALQQVMQPVKVFGAIFRWVFMRYGFYLNRSREVLRDFLPVQWWIGQLGLKR